MTDIASTKNRYSKLQKKCLTLRQPKVEQSKFQKKMPDPRDQARYILQLLKYHKKSF